MPTSRDFSPVDARRTVLTMLHRARASHLGSNMSVIEMLMAMYSSIDCEAIRDQHDDRSRVVISKGHCAAATYAVMAHHGILPFEALDTYHLDGSLLQGHVSHAVPGVEHSTGSLGHGLSVAVGCAMGLRVRGHGSTPVFALCGDGEIQEGSIWEALMLAGHHRLGSLVLLVDNNRISNITDTASVIDLNPLRRPFEGFDMDVREADGHDVDQIASAISDLLTTPSPGVVICNTVKGKDVPFAENSALQNYKPLDDGLLAEALHYLDGLESRAGAR